MIVHEEAIDGEDALKLHAVTLGLSGTSISCSQLKSRGADLAHHLGYAPTGIQKGSPAARVMSNEAKRYGGTIPSVKDGGITASLQSVGASGSFKQHPTENIRRALRRNLYAKDFSRLKETHRSRQW